MYKKIKDNLLFVLIFGGAILLIVLYYYIVINANIPDWLKTILLT